MSDDFKDGFGLSVGAGEDAENSVDFNEETTEISPEEARIRYYESQADIAREEADDGE